MYEGSIFLLDAWERKLQTKSIYWSILIVNIPAGNDKNQNFDIFISTFLFSFINFTNKKAPCGCSYAEKNTWNEETYYFEKY